VSDREPHDPAVNKPLQTTSHQVQHGYRHFIQNLKDLPGLIRKHAPFWPRRFRQWLRRDSRQAIRSIRRVGKERVYRLKGYTTVAKINRKRQAENQQRFLRNLLVVVISVLLIILLFNLYNPIKDLSEWYRIVGVKDLADVTGALEGSTTTLDTSKTAATTKTTTKTTTKATTKATTTKK
jgi:hypothetical protein